MGFALVIIGGIVLIMGIILTIIYIRQSNHYAFEMFQTEFEKDQGHQSQNIRHDDVRQNIAREVTGKKEDNNKNETRIAPSDLEETEDLLIKEKRD